MDEKWGSGITGEFGEIRQWINIDGLKEMGQRVNL
jgi:hypothetical protein